MTGIDLTDLINPVVVKEVRQGLKSKRFLAVFLMLVLAMTTGIAIALLPEEVSEMREMSTAIFWTIAGLCFLGLMPLLGVNAVLSEKKQHTFELVMLTRVTPWRMVFGKWLSLVVQTLLVATTLFPYLVLRHYIGGVELAVDLIVLFMLLIISTMLSAFVVFASTFENWIIRLGLIMLQLWLVIGTATATASGVMYRGGAAPAVTDRIAFFAVAALFVVMLVVLVLELAASRLAPISENHAVRKRGLALIVMAFALLFSSVDGGEGFVFLACVLLYFVAFDACTERFAPTPTLYAPFVRRGAIGRAAGFLFYPGPASATFFVLLASVLIPSMVLVIGHHDFSETLAVATTVASTLLVPLAICRVFARYVKRPGIVFLLFHAMMLLIAALGQVAMQVLGYRRSMSNLLALIPTTGLVSAVVREGSDAAFAAAIAVNGILAFVALAYLLVGRADDWRAIGEQERRAAELTVRRVE